MVSITEHLLHNNSDRKVTFLSSARSPATHAMRKVIDELAGTNANLDAVVYYTSAEIKGVDDLPNTKVVGGRIDAKALEGIKDAVTSDFYLCGPPAFLEAMRSNLTKIGVPDEQVYFEYFGPTL